MLLAEKNYLDINGQYSRYGYQTQTNDNRVKKAKKNNKTAKAVRTLLGISIFFVIGFIIVFRYATLTEMASSIDKQKKQIASLEKLNSQLKAETIMDLRTVDEIAKNKLGMDRPYKYQIVYVDLNKNITAPNVGNVASNEFKFEIVKKLNKVVEYLY